MDKITDIPPAKPTMSNNYSISFASGTTYKCNVRALENKSNIYLRYFMRWNGQNYYEEFDGGIITASIPDRVVGYYYTINSSSGNSLGSVSGASYQTSSAIPFDVSQIGQYIHVKAKSYSGALSDEKIIHLSEKTSIPFPKSQLTISCSTGIEKVTATGSVSGTTITATGSEKKSGSFYSGETITLTETPVSNGVFTDWTFNRSVSYLSGYDSGKATTKFRMPNAPTTATANGKLYYTVTVKPGEGIKSVTLDGETTSSSSGITKKYYEGDSYTISTILKDYYESPTWEVNGKKDYSKYNAFTEKMGTTNLTYTVSAQKQQCFVTYTGLSGASPGRINSESGAAGSTKTVTSTKVSKSGYSFAGWLCVEGSSDMLNKLYKGGESFVLKQRTIFAAQWKAGSTTINLYTNKPSDASSNVRHDTLISGDSFELKDVREYAEKSGYTVQNLVNANGIEYFGVFDSDSEFGIDDIEWYVSPDGFTAWDLGDLNYVDGDRVILYDQALDCYYKRTDSASTADDVVYITPYHGSRIKFVYIDWSYKIYSDPAGFDIYPVPATWTWNSINSSTGDGYYSKKYMDLMTGDAAVTLPKGSEAYSITGWKITGWNTSADLTGISYSASTNISSIPLTNESEKRIDLYAEWSPVTYTVRYMGNGGRIAGGSAYYDVTYKYDTMYTYPQSLFGKESQNNGTTSYHFTSWYNRAEMTGISYEVGEQFKNLTEISGGMIYRYAGWSAEKIHYQIHFNPNGASEKSKIADITGIEYSDNVLLPSASEYYSYEGYEFAGWILGTAASYEEYLAAPEKYQVFGTETKVSKLSNKNGATVQMYALWKPVEKEPACYTIHFKGNGADSGSMENQTILCGTADTKLNTNIFGLTDYKFTGWNTKPDGSGAAKEDGAAADFSAAEGDVITLYAQWIPDVYYVEYDGNGSEFGDMDKSVFAYNTEENLAGNEYEKTGYHTEDSRTWTARADGSGSSYADMQRVNNLAENPKGLIPNTVKLYVQWTANQYTIRFNGNGATGGSMADQIKTYGTPAALEENQYQRDGYEFSGWSMEADGSGGLLPDKYFISNDFSEKDKDVITLYAQWKDVKPPVIIPTGGSGIDLAEDELVYEWTNEDVVLQFTAEDTGSGMKTLHLESKDGKIKITDKDKIKKTITKEGISSYDLTAEDNTGNKSVLHITVKIDKIPPTADNEDEYVFDSSGIMTETIKAHDEGGSGIKSFELYSGNSEDEENPSLTLLKAADSVSGDNAELTYTFEDDMVSDSMYYTLVIADNAGNVTKKVFHVDAALSIQAKAWKYNKTTVTDNTETLTYMQYGDMRCWLETTLNGYMTEVTYDFCDELNDLGLEDVTHPLTPAETVTDNLVVYLPKTMVFEETYTVTIRGKRSGREVSVTLKLMHTEMKSKPHPAIRYQNDMAMPWGGGEWIDYENRR